MSTRERKERKRAGIRFEKAPHIGTPVAERAENMPKMRRTASGKIVHEITNSVKRRLLARGVELKGEK